MHQINPKKFKEIKNKTIPNPLRPKFRQKAQSNIYFLSQRKVNSEKKLKLIKNNNIIISLFIYSYVQFFESKIFKLNVIIFKRINRGIWAR